jgi:toxin CptA
MTSAPAIGFEYVPSRWPPRLLVGMAMLSTLAVLGCAAVVWIKLALIALVMASTWRARKSVSARTVFAVGLSATDDWTLRHESGEDASATLASFRWLGPFVLLRLCTEGLRPQVVLLAPDNSDDDIRRRLRMRLAAMVTVEGAARV